MRLIWNEPPKTSVPWNQYSSLHWDSAIIGWLNYMGVYPERDNAHWQCEYNYVYHFFDIHIYECWLPNRGAPDTAIKAMLAYLKHSCLDWEASHTWKWDNGKYRPGVRFWIRAEDHPRRTMP